MVRWTAGILQLGALDCSFFTGLYSYSYSLRNYRRNLIEQFVVAWIQLIILKKPLANLLFWIPWVYQVHRYEQLVTFYLVPYLYVLSVFLFLSLGWKLLNVTFSKLHMRHLLRWSLTFTCYFRVLASHLTNPSKVSWITVNGVPTRI